MRTQNQLAQPVLVEIMSLFNVPGLDGCFHSTGLEYRCTTETICCTLLYLSPTSDEISLRITRRSFRIISSIRVVLISAVEELGRPLHAIWRFLISCLPD
ncbi:hypothetical protein TNCV_819751 [Trichonephila clavipes]|nr:hypothetical protein TNCV_819751 [Trichonephila clavipes]